MVHVIVELKTGEKIEDDFFYFALDEKQDSVCLLKEVSDKKDEVYRDFRYIVPMSAIDSISIVPIEDEDNQSKISRC